MAGASLLWVVFPCPLLYKVLIAAHMGSAEGPNNNIFCISSSRDLMVSASMFHFQRHRLE